MPITLMRAAVFHGSHDIRIDEVDEPVTGPGEVKVAVANNGLCGSDLHEYLSGPLAVPTAPHPLTGAQLPVIMGHEFSGTVVDIGDGVTTVTVGDRVAVEPLYQCGQCRPDCRRRDLAPPPGGARAAWRAACNRPEYGRCRCRNA
jgi:(R,R)-butanediol dehydrogenase/meso-butanediol dehydrogenase/diacetyl reductase